MSRSHIDAGFAVTNGIFAVVFAVLAYLHRKGAW